VSDGYLTDSEDITITVTAPPLEVSISPTSASILVGQSVTFTSTPSGGYSPYSYQWYLGGVQVSGATSGTWTFTPTTSGIYYVYLQVKDANNNTAQSETARITVGAVPVGGYSISLAKRTPTSQIAAYTLLIALFGAALSLRKRKRK
jgi:PKD repeat protein